MIPSSMTASAQAATHRHRWCSRSQPCGFPQLARECAGRPQGVRKP